MMSATSSPRGYRIVVGEKVGAGVKEIRGERIGWLSRCLPVCGDQLRNIEAPPG